MKFQKIAKKVALWALTAGAINWGLTKFLNVNVVDMLGTTIAPIVYLLVLASGVYAVYLLLTSQLK